MLETSGVERSDIRTSIDSDTTADGGTDTDSRGGTAPQSRDLQRGQPPGSSVNA